MGSVIVDVSPSADGYIAGRGVAVERPFGDAGHRLHHWLGFDGITPSREDHEAAARMFATTGAVVIGRRMFDVGIDTWGADGAFERPTFVVTRRPRADLVRGATTFRFVEGVERAVGLAQEAAGGADVVVAGGAEIVRQCLSAQLVDELRLHVVPVLLGGGTRLFDDSDLGAIELEGTGVVSTRLATHLTYRVSRGSKSAPPS